MLGEGEWNNLGPGGLNKIGACPLSRGGYILFPGGGGGGGVGMFVIIVIVGVYG